MKRGCVADDKHRQRILFSNFLISEKYHSLLFFFKDNLCQAVCSFRMFPWAQEDREAGG